MKIGIIGSRTFNDYNQMKNTLDSIEHIDLIISGGAKGADSFAERYAESKGIETCRIYSKL